MVEALLALTANFSSSFFLDSEIVYIWVVVTGEKGRHNVKMGYSFRGTVIFVVLYWRFWNLYL